MKQNIQRVLDRVAGAAARRGRAPSDIALVAVSKKQPPERILEAAGCGLVLFGESRVQEAKVKIPLLPERLRWHFVGHLQRNKIRQALPLFELFHGIDNARVAADMDRIADELGLNPAVLLEVNVAGEGTKFGFDPDTIRGEIEGLLALHRIEIAGLMAMAPYAEDPELARPHFARLRQLRDALQDEFRIGLPHLSMGMSGDFEIAVEEGATLVRVGTALFGDREPE